MGVLEQLVARFSALTVKNSTDLAWALKITQAFARLVRFAEEDVTTQAMHVCVLKNAKIFFDSLNKRLSSQISGLFDTNKAIVEKLIQQCQAATTVLQKIMHGNKFGKKRSSNVTSSIPAVKRAIETFIYQAKRLFLDNNQLARFSIRAAQVQGDSSEDE